MFDPLTENPITLAEAAKLPCFPGRRRGKRPNLATLYRWSTSGCRGVVLETIQIGGTRCTSREALSRFFERLTAQAVGNRLGPRNKPTPAERKRQIEAARRRVEAVL